MRSMLSLACLLAAMSPAISHGEVTFDTVALSGDPAPGTPAGVTFGEFSTPFLNDIGEAAFSATLAGPGVVSTNNYGLFSEVGGGLRLVAREGDPAPGTPAGVTFSSQSNPVLNIAGQAAFSTSLTGTGVDFTNNQALYLESGGTLDLIVRAGDPAAGLPAGVVHTGFLNNIALNDAGQIAFGSFQAGPGVNDYTDDHSLYLYSGGTFNLIARAGTPAPDIAADANFSGLYHAPRLNNAGQMAFLCGLVGTGANSSNNSSAIFSEAGGSLGLVAQSGNPAPGAPAGVTFRSFEPLEFNDAGDTAFFAYLDGPGIDGTNDGSIFMETGGTLAPVVLAGDPAPGAGAGVNINWLTTPQLNNSGQIAFRGGLAGSGVDSANDGAIYLATGGVLDLIAREGDQAPDVEAGVNFDRLEHSPLVNDAGQVAFAGRLTGVGVNSSNNFGLFATRPDGVLELVARRGDLFDVNPDPLIVDNRLISSIYFFNVPDGSGQINTSLNDADQLIFGLKFSDNSTGIFIANIPEPASFALLVAAGLPLLRRPR